MVTAEASHRYPHKVFTDWIRSKQYDPTQVANGHCSDSRDDTQLLQDLASRTAPDAVYHTTHHQSSPKCRSTTIADILIGLRHWVEEPRTAKPRICWVYGSAGVGKSAIAQSLAKEYAGTRLAATFFFSRKDPTSLKRFVATVAYQLCTLQNQYSILRTTILDALRSNPHIFENAVEHQFRKLVLEPYLRLNDHQRQNIPNLIIVDQLDACNSPHILLETLGLACSFPTGFQFRFLVCSRYRLQIQKALDSTDFALSLDRIEISTVSGENPNIQQYFIHHFDRLRKEHPDLSYEREWPSQDDIRTLVRRASGQFVFATTAVKFIDDERPQDRLRMLVNADPEDAKDSPYSALDMLYRTVLSTCRWDRVYQVLRLLVTPHPHDTFPPCIRWHSPSILAALFELGQDEVRVMLSSLCSVLHIPEDDQSDIHIFHISFTEFLLSETRSGKYHVPQFSQAEYCNLVAWLLLHITARFAHSYPPYCTDLSFGVALFSWKAEVDAIGYDLTCFSIDSWQDYCLKIDSPSPAVLAELDMFDPYSAAAMLASRKGLGWSLQQVCDWVQCVEWAKSLDEAPHKFIERLESFFLGFRVAFDGNTPAHSAMAITFESEGTLANLHDRYMARRVRDFVGAYYDRWWPSRSGSSSSWPLILPSTNCARSVPDHWVIARVTQMNGILLKRVYGVYTSFDFRKQQLFDEDIVNNLATDNTILKDDLVHFKALLYERRDIFAVLVNDGGYEYGPGDEQACLQLGMSENSSRHSNEHKLANHNRTLYFERASDFHEAGADKGAQRTHDIAPKRRTRWILAFLAFIRGLT